MQAKTSRLCCSGTNDLLISDFGSSTREERHNSYCANHPQRAAHLVVFEISVSRDPKILTAAVTVENSILSVPMAETQSSASMIQCQPSTDSLKILKFSGPPLPGMTSFTLQPHFLSWGLLWQWWLSYPLHASVKLHPMTTPWTKRLE